MKRLVYLISTFLILTGMYGGNVGAKQVLLVSQSVGRTIYHVPGANRPISIDAVSEHFGFDPGRADRRTSHTPVCTFQCYGSRETK